MRFEKRGAALAEEPGRVTAFLDDVRLAVRSLVRTPALLATLLLSIGVGVGSNVVVHGFARGLTMGDATPDGDAVQRLESLLGLAAGLVLIIAVGNVASLLIGRSAARAQETSMRLALGASRARLARRVLIESVAIAGAGAALGTLIASWLARVIPALLFVDDADRLTFAADPVEIAAIAAACAGVTVACGLAPALSIAHATPAAVLRRESAGASPLMTRIRQTLLIAQLGCCCALVISAGLILERLASARKTEVARGLGEAVLATVNAHPNVGLRYFSEIERVATTGPPALSVLAWTATLPGTQPTWRSYRAEPAGLASRTIELSATVLNKDVLTRLSLPPREGRLFSLMDGGCLVAVANEQAARLLFDTQSVGRIVEEPSGQLVEIIGVVREQPGGAADQPAPRIFYPEAEGGQPSPSTRTRFRTAVAAPLAPIRLDTRVASASYFDAMAATLVAGQLTRSEQQSACRVGVVNQQAADRYFGGNAVGGAVIDHDGLRTEIVGVVRTLPVGAFERSSEPAIYLPMAQDWVPQMTVFLGAPNVTGPMLAALRERLDAVQGRGRLPPTVKTLETYLGETALAPLRIAMAIVAVFAGTAVLLSAIGLYGALADAARRRNRELAIRVALGARRVDVVVLMLGAGGRLVAAGSIAGVAGALLLSELLTETTPGSAPPFGWTWLAGPLLLVVAVLGASLLPARRGAMVDPVAALRDDC